MGSLNLSEFVLNPFTKDACFDFDEFAKAVKIAIRELNEVLLEGMSLHPLEIQRQTVNDWRQIGCGIFALGDMLIKLGIRYGSDESVALCDKIGFTMINNALLESSKIAKEQGVYPKFNRDAIASSNFIMNNTDVFTYDQILEHGLAHSQILTIAPTGSLSTMLGTTGGIEPMFATHYTRKTESLHGEDVYYKVYTPIVNEVKNILNLTEDDELPSYIVTANNLNYRERINMQSVWQDHIDASISSTVNVNNDFTVEEVEDLYMYAWEKGLKGVTIYRDGCKRGGILTTDSPKKEDTNELQRGEWKPLAEDAIYIKKTLKIGCSNGLKLFIGYSPSEKSIQDLYIKRAYSGGCLHNLEGLVIGLSAVYRLGGSTHNIEKAFRGLGGCNSFLQARMNGKELSKGSSCATAILNVLKEFEKEMQLNPIAVQIEESVSKSNAKFTQDELDYIKLNGETEFAKEYNKCPICGENELQHSGGCIQCVCGYSKCD